MSTIKVDSIQSSDGNTDLLTLSNGSVSGVNFGRRNLIINGAMQVWQRGTSFSEGSNQFTADRWQINSTTGVVSRSTDVPSGEGFTYSMKQAPSSGNNFLLIQGVELPATGSAGLFEVGTTFTLSFWVKGNASDSIDVYYQFRDIASSSTNAVSAAATDTISYTSSWTRVTTTFTITGSVAVTNKSFCVIPYVSATSGEELYITGVQLEVGSVATPFEHRSYGEELALCQRYYWESSTAGAYYAFQYVYSYKFLQINHPVPMRATPTATVVFSGGTFSEYGTDEYQYKAYVASSYSDAYTYNTSSAKFDAEL